MKTRSLLLIFSFVSGSFSLRVLLPLSLHGIPFISRENEREEKKKYTRQFEPKAHGIPSWSSGNSSIYKFPSFFWKIKTCLTKYLRVQELEAFLPLNPVQHPFPLLTQRASQMCSQRPKAGLGSLRKRASCRKQPNLAGSCTITERAGLCRRRAGLA